MTANCAKIVVPAGMPAGIPTGTDAAPLQPGPGGTGKGPTSPRRPARIVHVFPGRMSPSGKKVGNPPYIRNATVAGSAPESAIAKVGVPASGGPIVEIVGVQPPALAQGAPYGRGASAPISVESRAFSSSGRSARSALAPLTQIPASSPRAVSSCRSQWVPKGNAGAGFTPPTTSVHGPK